MDTITESLDLCHSTLVCSHLSSYKPLFWLSTTHWCCWWCSVTFPPSHRVTSWHAGSVYDNIILAALRFLLLMWLLICLCLSDAVMQSQSSWTLIQTVHHIISLFFTHDTIDTWCFGLNKKCNLRKLFKFLILFYRVLWAIVILNLLSLIQKYEFCFMQPKLVLGWISMNNNFFCIISITFAAHWSKAE